MKRLAGLIVEVTEDLLSTFAYVVKNNLMNAVNLANFILPYLMYFVGQEFYKLHGIKDGYVFGVALIIPIIFDLLTYYTKSIANKIGKGITVPIPQKRFTEVDEDGMVSVDNNRIQELLLYVADLEDWLEKKKLM